MPSSHGGGGSGGHGGGGGFHSSGGGRGSSPRYSTKKPFPGSTRYHYINSRGSHVYFYYAGVPTRSNSIGSVIFLSFFALVAIVMAVVFMVTLIPHKISASKCNEYPSYYDDNAGIISDSGELEISLKRFYDKTGIQPYIYTMVYDDLPPRYGAMTMYSIEDFAYDLYVSTFNDEGHYMIVFAVNPNTTRADNKWMWVDMAGDDTQNLFDDDFFAKFQKEMQTYLNISSVSIEQSLILSFDYATENIMNFETEDVITLLMILGFLSIFIIIPIVLAVKEFKRVKIVNEYCSYRDAHPEDQDDGRTVEDNELYSSSSRSVPNKEYGHNYNKSYTTNHNDGRDNLNKKNDDDGFFG